MGTFPWVAEPLIWWDQLLQPVVSTGPTVGDVENGFHSDFHWVMALEQLQEGTQLALPPPLPAEPPWSNATLPMGRERLLLAAAPGAMGRYLQANPPFLRGQVDLY